MANNEMLGAEAAEVKDTVMTDEVLPEVTAEVEAEVAAEVVAEEVADEAVEETVPAVNDASKKPSVGARIKEWFRKRVVKLKRKPQSIGFIVLVITCFFWLCSLNTLSPGPYDGFAGVSWLGFCLFVTTLFSILVIVLYMNTFPKYPKANKKTGKKHKINYAMLVLTFVFMACMIIADAFFFSILRKQISGNESLFFANIDQALKYRKFWSPAFEAKYQDCLALEKVNFAALELSTKNAMKSLIPSLKICIAHISLVSVCAVLLATLPLYKKLIMKINTRKEVAGNNIKETIDVED